MIGSDGSPTLSVIGMSNGNVGIGTTLPSAKLNVYSGAPNALSVFESGTSGNSWITVKNSVGSLNAGLGSSPSTNGFGYVWSSGGNFMIGSDGSPTLSVIGMSNGNVGIGTTDPGSFKLAVNGKTWSTEVQVAVNRPPDYVFEPTYDLKPLAEIETYIKENKHLPEVPSATEMEKNGVQLGEMNMLLLKKVEELTLYVIELKKRDEAQQKEIEQLKIKK
jgi:hypothetical protein